MAWTSSVVGFSLSLSRARSSQFAGGVDDVDGWNLSGDSGFASVDG